jgi:mannose-6-phosphate isomerase-like protein (cupin superfamily)
MTKFAEVEWHVPVSKREDVDYAYVPGEDEAGRKFLVEGQGGFWVQAVRIPPDFTAPVHRHSHAEVFMVVAGEATFNGYPMGPLDCTVVEAETDYSFTSGPDGVTFMVTRQAVASYSEPAK